MTRQNKVVLNSEKEFDSIHDKAFDGVTNVGNSEQVLTAGYTADTGKAILTPDFLPVGQSFLVRQTPDYRCFVYKKSETEFIPTFQVFQHAEDRFRKELQDAKDLFSTLTSEQKKQFTAWYVVPEWIMFDISMNTGAHPSIDEAKFEQVLWDNYPHLWIDESKAPKSFIL